MVLFENTCYVSKIVNGSNTAISYGCVSANNPAAKKQACESGKDGDVTFRGYIFIYPIEMFTENGLCKNICIFSKLKYH